MQAVLLLSTLSAITVLKISSGEVNLVPMTLSDSSREISIFGGFKLYFSHTNSHITLGPPVAELEVCPV